VGHLLGQTGEVGFRSEIFLWGLEAGLRA
jgi:hypothetical protein